MKTYQSHKIVEAGRISSMETRGEGFSVGVDDDAEHFRLTEEEGKRILHAADAVGMKLMEGNLVRYEGGYWSWSPADVFDDGYAEVVHGGDTALGYLIKAKVMMGMENNTERSSRDLSVAITEVETGMLWLQEHIRKHNLAHAIAAGQQ